VAESVAAKEAQDKAQGDVARTGSLEALVAGGSIRNLASAFGGSVEARPRGTSGKEEAKAAASKVAAAEGAAASVPSPSTAAPSPARRLSTRERIVAESVAAKEAQDEAMAAAPAPLPSSPTKRASTAPNSVYLSRLSAGAPPPTSPVKRPSLENLGGGGLGAIKENYRKNLEHDATAPDPSSLRRRPSQEAMTGLKDKRRSAFTTKMVADNAKRGVGSDESDADLASLIGRAAASDSTLTTLDLSGAQLTLNQQFSWLSAPKRLEALERVAHGSALTVLLLDSLGLALPVAPALAAAVRSHTKLERFSVERNGLNEASLLLVAEACAGHPALTTLSVGNQCNQELLTQSALIALIDAMEKTPKMTQLHVGKIIDPSLRRRHESVTMSNRDLLRKQRVAAGQKDARAAAGQRVDWAAEARHIAQSKPFEHGTPPGGVSGDPQRTYSVLNSPLWRAATDKERVDVFCAFASNTVVTSLVLVNAQLSDSMVASAVVGVLQKNTTLTSLSLESNMISSTALEAIAAGLGGNQTLTELRLANQGVAGSQVAEMSLAQAVDANQTLLHLTVDLRSMRAREIIQTALSRNQDRLRQKRRSLEVARQRASQ